MRGDAGLDLLARGLRDEDVKVRIGACQALGGRSEPRASTILASTTSSDAENSVRLAAVSALANHQGQHVVTALRAALQNKDPAFQLAAMQSLEKVTKAGIGNDAEAWVAYLDQGTEPSKPKSIRDRWF
jgi:HEAT repeat protein